jgi:hypothetical protein
MLCQRYCYVTATGLGYQIGIYSSGAGEFTIRLPVTMRAAPTFSSTVTGYGASAGNYKLYSYSTLTGAGAPATASLSCNLLSTDQANLVASCSPGGLTNGFGVNIDLVSPLNLKFSAEL